MKEDVADSAIMKVDGYNAPRAAGTYVISPNIPEAWRLYPSLVLDESFSSQEAEILDISDSSDVSDMVFFSWYSNGANAH